MISKWSQFGELFRAVLALSKSSALNAFNATMNSEMD